jgi:hypothetical protein
MPIPSGYTSGQVIQAVVGVGKILQVVTATYATSTTSSSNVYADTGLTVSITPSSTSSKILVMVSQNGCVKTSSDTELALRLVRGATELCIFAIQGGITGSSATNGFGSCSHVFLDTPATTSSTTYKTQMRSVSNSAAVNTQSNSTQSSICVMEISA